MDLPTFTSLTVLILLSLMSSGSAATSNSSQAALDARARLSNMRYERIASLCTLLYDFDYETYNLELKRRYKEELELKEKIKNLDPEVIFFLELEICY